MLTMSYTMQRPQVPEPFGLAIRCTELLPSEEPAATILRRVARQQQQSPAVPNVGDQNGGHAAVVVAGRIPPGIITEKLGDLGRGSFGVVIKAKTTCERGLPAVVAVKQMHVSHGPKASPHDIDDEAAVIAAIPAHPNVVRLYGWGQLFGKPSLVFELCEEGDLHSYLKSHTRAGVRSVPPVTVLDLSQQIATGMKHIHANRLYVDPSSSSSSPSSSSSSSPSSSSDSSTSSSSSSSSSLLPSMPYTPLALQLRQLFV